MRNKPETQHVYNIPGLHWWFLISSAAFIVCVVLMIWTDYSSGIISWLGLRGDRQWKNHQRAFYDLEKKRLASDAKAAEIRTHEAGLGTLTKELEDARREIEQSHTVVQTRRAELKRANDVAFIINRDFTMAKALRDEYRSFYEAALERNGMNREALEVQGWERKVTSQNAVVDNLDLSKQSADLKVKEAQAALDEIVGNEDALQRKIKRLTGSIELLNKRLAELRSPLVQTVVNLPLIEFAAPTYKVEQIVADNHHVNVNFATVPRVDRCVTCHKGIDRKDPSPEEVAFRKKNNIESIEWSKLPQPLTAHPRLDLFVSETSPHPASTYGCTVCHWGWDRETDFSRAGHTPRDENQKQEWKKKYNWTHQEFLAQPMRSSQHIQASCLKCHTQQTHLPGAEKLDHGRRLIGQLGCWSCHKMKQLETYSTHTIMPGEDFDGICKFYDVDQDKVRRLNNLPAHGFIRVVPPDEFQKVKASPSEHYIKTGQELSIPIRTLHKDGPSLYKLATKTDKEWTRQWLANPVHFKPNTYMPRFWGMDNSLGPQRDAVEINAVTEFLFAVSQNGSLPEPPVKGDAETGKQLVGQLGCTGCHVIDEKIMDLRVPDNMRANMDDWEYRRARTQGPQLAGLGSKTTRNWLFAWVKDPKKYHNDTKMPSLRLSDQEAADIAEYLFSLRNSETTNAKQPDMANPDSLGTLKDVTLEYLQVALPRKLAEQKLDQLHDLIEPYFADNETMPYFRDPSRLAREQAQIKALQAEYEETFDDALDRKAKELAAHVELVNRKIQEAKDRVAALDETQKRNIFLGSKLIARYGCYACHNIHGFENAKPIGTELSEWGSKPVSKLDFGLLNLEHDRIAWLVQKLKAARSYDNGRIGITRSSQELLKMPQFNLTEEQIDQIVTFVTGMTDETLTYQEPRQLSPAEFHIERGRWLVKELNCVGCHILEGRGGAFRATGIVSGMEPPMLSGTPTQLRQGQRTKPDWLFDFLKAPVTGEVRPWLKVRMPTFGLSDAEDNVLVKYFALEGHTQFPYVSQKINDDPVHLAAGKQLFDKIKCGLCHIVEGKALGKPLHEIPEADLPRLAPNLSLARARLQRDWLIDKWIPNPAVQVPGTRMPQFEYGANIAPEILGGDGRKQIEAMVDYMLSLGSPSAREASKVPPEPSAMKDPLPETSKEPTGFE